MIAPSVAAPLDMPVTPRNPGMPLELDWVENARVNRSAVERRAATLRTGTIGSTSAHCSSVRSEG